MVRFLAPSSAHRRKLPPNCSRKKYAGLASEMAPTRTGGWNRPIIIGTSLVVFTDRQTNRHTRKSLHLPTPLLCSGLGLGLGLGLGWAGLGWAGLGRAGWRRWVAVWSVNITQGLPNESSIVRFRCDRRRERTVEFALIQSRANEPGFNS
jgi:hypothetical protein